MNVAAGCIATSTADVNLVMQLGKEGFRINGGAACAYQAGAARCGSGNLEVFGRGCLVACLGRIDLDEVSTQAQSNACSTGDQSRSLLVGNSLAARIRTTIRPAA